MTFLTEILKPHKLNTGKNVLFIDDLVHDYFNVRDIYNKFEQYTTSPKFFLKLIYTNLTARIPLASYPSLKE
jgi:hypothetical protein